MRLSTVPATNGVVAPVFCVRYLAMLSGFTFLSHPIGSLLGAWPGGLMFDRTGGYSVVWCLAIALGVVAGLLNLPIDDRELKRGTAARATA
jgi:predicted MFS family arabinose efflux permease